MAWPKGKPRKSKAEVTAEPTTQTQKMPQPSQDPQPPLQQRRTPLQIAADKAAAEKVRPRMKARPNWENYNAAEDSEDKLHIDRELFPEGYDLQWVTDRVYGQPQPQHRAQFERKGWTPVHQEDFDGAFDGKFMAKGKEGEIDVDGLVLMARPLEYSVRAKQSDRRKAQEQVFIKEQALRGGDLPVSLDSQHPTAIGSNKINRSYERIDIPKE